MRRMILLCVAVLSIGMGCSSAGRNRVTQISTIDAILAGAYDGQISCRKLRSYGTLGIGTFDTLDGEMVLLDGRIYQIRADGKAYKPKQKETTPFASVVDFKTDITAPLAAGTDFQELEKLLNAAVPNQNLFCAVRVHGSFKTMKTRSVPAQKKPYPPLTEVTRHQPEFEFKNISGTIVGFRCPAYVKGIGVPGYHLHFITKDRTAGGHVLSLTIDHAEAEIDICNKFFLILPDGEGQFAEINLGKDRSKALEKAER